MGMPGSSETGLLSFEREREGGREGEREISTLQNISNKPIGSLQKMLLFLTVYL